MSEVAIKSTLYVYGRTIASAARLNPIRSNPLIFYSITEENNGQETKDAFNKPDQINGTSFFPFTKWLCFNTYRLNFYYHNESWFNGDELLC